MADGNPAYQGLLQDVAFLAIGTGIIVSALVWSRRLGARQVELSVAKLGLNLKADRLTFILLLGFLMAGVGVFFRYRGYETQLNELREKLSQVNSRTDMLTDELRGFKDYELRLNLAFPDDVDPRDLKVQVLSKKLDDNVFKLLDIQAENDLGGIWVKLNNLSRGEKIKIKAEGRDTIWESTDIEIPKTQIQMTQRKP